VLQALASEHVEVEIWRADELAQRRGLASELDLKHLPWSEGRVKYPKFVKEPLDVTDADIELRQCVDVSRGATRR